MSGLTFCLQAEYPERESEKCHTEGCAVMNESRKKLCELVDGECARVAALETGAQLTGRMTELGLLPGTAVRCRLRAPSGSPIVYEIPRCVRRHPAEKTRRRSRSGRKRHGTDGAVGRQRCGGETGVFGGYDAQARVLALAGNPNVGKSTIFNALTGRKQHTGNWPGKTVTVAEGLLEYKAQRYVLIDLPGTYALTGCSEEERVAAEFIRSGQAQCVVAVCDATCLERNLHLVLQLMELTTQLIVCVNLLDEAEKMQIEIDLHALERELGVPVGDGGGPPRRA